MRSSLGLTQPLLGNDGQLSGLDEHLHGEHVERYVT